MGSSLIWVHFYYNVDYVRTQLDERALDPVAQSVGESDCRSSSHELEPGLVPYFRGD